MPINKRLTNPFVFWQFIDRNADVIIDLLGLLAETSNYARVISALLYPWGTEACTQERGIAQKTGERIPSSRDMVTRCSSVSCWRMEK